MRLWQSSYCILKSIIESDFPLKDFVTINGFKYYSIIDVIVVATRHFFICRVESDVVLVEAIFVCNEGIVFLLSQIQIQRLQRKHEAFNLVYHRTPAEFYGRLGLYWYHSKCV